VNRFTWASGPWSVAVREDELADIRYAGRPVLRAVRGVARDARWETVPARVRDTDTDDDRLDLAIDLVGLGAGIDARLGMRVLDDALTVTFDAYLRTSFRRSRIGLVLLHPASLAGVPLTVTSPSGATTSTRFPVELLPHQPATDIAGLSWTAEGVATEVTFTGDVFEMEDQRNWTDASFKTYSTPLALPFPVDLAAGSEIHQSVTIRCVRTARVALQETRHGWPVIGLGASTAAGASPVPVTLPVAHVLVELDAASGVWLQALARAAEEAGDRPLVVQVVADRPGQLDTVLDALIGRPVTRLAVHDRHSQVTEPPLWTALRDGADTRLRTELVGGSRSHFTELSRARDRLPVDLPALGFALTPQMHATDDAQLVESVAMQVLVTAGAVEMAQGRPVHVGPVTLRQRYLTADPDPQPDPSTDVAQGYGAEHVPGATDPRQTSTATAAWTLATGMAHARGGARSLTLFETWGPRGVVDANGSPYPAARAVGWLAEATGAVLWEPADPTPDDLWLAGAETPDGIVLLAANLAATPVLVDVAVPGIEPWTVRLGPSSVARRDAVLRFDHHESEGGGGWR
jgi:hypothetical protein